MLQSYNLALSTALDVRTGLICLFGLTSIASYWLYPIPIMIRYDILHPLIVAIAMATVQSDGYTYILMKDVQGEKAPGMIKAVLMGSAPKRVQLLRGELLSSIPQRERDRVPRNDGTSAHNFRSKKDPSVTLYVDDTNVCPAMGKEVQLLEAIEKPYDRFTVFSMENRLEWGSGLGKGDQVFVKLPTPNTSVPTWSIGLVRYAESVDGLPGWNFGVEIKVQ